MGLSTLFVMLGLLSGVYPRSALGFLNLPLKIEENANEARIEGTVSSVKMIGSQRQITIRSTDSRTVILKQDGRVAGAGYPQEGMTVVTWYDEKSQNISPVGSNWLIKTPRGWETLVGAKIITRFGDKDFLNENELREILNKKNTTANAAGTVAFQNFPKPNQQNPDQNTESTTPSESDIASQNMEQPERAPASESDSNRERKTQGAIPWIVGSLLFIVCVVFLGSKRAIKIIPFIVFSLSTQAAPKPTTQSYLDLPSDAFAQAVWSPDRIEVQIQGFSAELPSLTKIQRSISLPELERTLLYFPSKTRVYVSKNNAGTRVWWE